MSADETETGKVDGHVGREDDIATVAFWYQIGQPRPFPLFPPLSERTFRDLDTVIEAQELTVAARHSPGRIEVENCYDWTGEGRLVFTPEAGGASFFEVDFHIEQPEFRGLVPRLTSGPDFERYLIPPDGREIDGLNDDPEWSPRGPFDGYSASPGIKDLHLGSYRLAKGSHTQRFEGLASYPLASGSALGLDSIRLRERWPKKRPSLRQAGGG